MSLNELVCNDCNSNLAIELCINCKNPVCPSHRAGLGSVSDGYTCKNCHGFGFPGLLPVAPPTFTQRWVRFVGTIPYWIWILFALIVGQLISVGMELWKGRP